MFIMRRGIGIDESGRGLKDEKHNRRIESEQVGREPLID